MSTEGINKIMNKEPLRDKGDKHNKITSGEEGEPETEPKPDKSLSSGQETEEEEKEEKAEREPIEDQPGEEEEEEKPEQEKETDKMMVHRETNISPNDINEHSIKIIDDFYKDNDGEKFFKRIKYLAIMLPESKFGEVAEKEAEKLSQMNINGVKLFKDIAEARQFLYDLRYGKRGRFKGQNQKFYKLPKIQKIINQSKQTKQTISPMMTRNIKPLSRTNYIYEY